MKIDCLIQRKIFNADVVTNTPGVRNCIGEWFVRPEGEDWRYFCYTLEDQLRADGDKVYGKTCIPADDYKGIITISPKFGEVLLIYNKPDYSIDSHGMKFKGVLAHGGQHEDHSLGCVLVAYNINKERTRIQGSAKEDLKNLLKKYTEINIKIENKIFAEGLTKAIIK